MNLWSELPSGLTIGEVIKTLSYVKNPIVLGEHYFITNPITGTGLSPRWDFTSHAFKGNPNAFVVGNKTGDLAAPTGPQDIDWLYLKAIQGELANEVYRTDTRLGQPPASVGQVHSRYFAFSLMNQYQCTPGDTSTTSVKYVSKYCMCLLFLFSCHCHANSLSIGLTGGSVKQ